WQGNEGQEALTFGQQGGEIRSLAFGRDSERIASAGRAPPGSHNTAVKVWDVRSGRVNVEFTGHSIVVFDVAWHPDGQRIASAGLTIGRTPFVVKVWDARSGREAFAL